MSINPSLLKDEADIYRFLSDDVDIPRVYAYETECEYNTIIFDLLGPSLEDLFNFCDRKFSLKTMLMLVDQLLYRLEYIHSKSVIHRDIKPKNFLISVRKQRNLIYATDLSLATKRLTAQINIDRTRNSHLIDTARLASINDRLDVDKCDILGSCCAKTDHHPNPTSLR